MGDFDGSYVTGVSADGSLAIGGSGGQLVFWEDGEARTISGLEGRSGVALDISPDGGAVVGWTYVSGNSGATHPFLWLSDTVTDLGTLGGASATASGVSANGSVVVGTSGLAGDEISHAFIWTKGAMTDLGAEGGVGSSATGVSASGKVVVGYLDLDDEGSRHAFRWTESGGMTDLGTLAGGTHSRALATSADGSVVVGAGNQAGNLLWDHAFRWEGGAMTDLGTLGGESSRALGVSGDGLVVVGVADNASNDYRAFRWTQARGMQDVADWLADAGVSVPAGWVLETAEGVNANGSVLVGSASSQFSDEYTAWLARVGSTESGLLTNIPIYNESVSESGSRGVTAGVALPGLALFGAHHRTLLDSGLARRDGGACGWVTGDGAGDRHTDTRAEVLEVGVCKDVGALRFGLGVGQDWARQDWTLGGGANMKGQHLIAEADYQFSAGLEGSVLGYYGRFDTDMRRHYMNGAVVDGSTGQPDADSVALRLRLDWKDLARLAGFSMSPYGAYTWSRTELDAYTETGGAFPASFGASRWTVNDLRVGAAAVRPLDAFTDLRLGLELVHRFEGSTNAVTGSVIGLWDFSLPGTEVKQNWARLLVDVERRLSDTLVLTLGGSAASEGGDASWALTAGLRATF